MNTAETLDLHSTKPQAVVLVNSISIVFLHLNIVCVLVQYMAKKLLQQCPHLKSIN